MGTGVTEGRNRPPSVTRRRDRPPGSKEVIPEAGRMLPTANVQLVDSDRPQRPQDDMRRGLHCSDFIVLCL